MTKARSSADFAAGGPNVAGKNCIINGGMDIFQRTTSTGFNAYALDRWYIGSSGGVTTTQSTAKTTPNSQYMMLMTASTTQQIFAYQVIETKNAIYYAGKTVTLSAYAAGLTTTTNLIMVLQYSTSVDVGMGGSWTDITVASGNANLTLSSTVTRWSATYSVPSDAKSLRVLFVNNAANITVGQGIYLGDVQLEVGSVATAFSRAGGTLQGELAACQRYYFRQTGAENFSTFGLGSAVTTLQAKIFCPFPVTMRTKPSSVDFSTLALWDTSTLPPITSLTLSESNTTYTNVTANVASGLTAFRPWFILGNNNSAAYLGFSAEL